MLLQTGGNLLRQNNLIFICMPVASPIVIAQLNPTTADITGNTELVIQTLEKIRPTYPDALVIFPEMMISGYCAQDFLLRPDFIERCRQSILTLVRHTRGLSVILGSPVPYHLFAETHPDHANGHNVVNAAIFYHHGEVKNIYAKKQLPNYGVFDEKRYFCQGNKDIILQHNGQAIGILVCEDGWQKSGYQYFIDHKVAYIVSINASPFTQHKSEQRMAIANTICQATQTPLIYVNLVGAQDELVFDGGSFALTQHNTQLCLPQFESGAFVMSCMAETATFRLEEKMSVEHPCASEALLPSRHGYNAQSSSEIDAQEVQYQRLYCALQLGLRDYVIKNKFQQVLLGLSGGIDSALTCAIAVDTLGADKVLSVMLSSPYTSQLSIDLAKQQADMLGIKHDKIDLLEAMGCVENALMPVWGRLPDERAVSRQNIQARLRGLLLMALANETHALLLSTGNKSELSVGYATLYGDMAGGFSPIKDIYKTQVYALSAYRNRLSVVIPKQVIARPPTAELAPNQQDTDSLPDYGVLDAILEKFIEKRLSIKEITEQGYASDMVTKVTQMVLKNQHKRRQGSIGTKVSSVAFGRDYRYPNTQRWQ